MSVSEPCANVGVDVCVCVCACVRACVCVCVRVSINTKQQQKHTKMSCFEHFILNTLTWRQLVSNTKPRSVTGNFGNEQTDYETQDYGYRND